MAEVSVLVDAGRATAAAPLGPALGPLGVNIGEIVRTINDKTKEFAGMKVPVKITVHSDKRFEVSVGLPPTSALIKKEIGIEKGAKNPKLEKAGDLSFEQAKKIAGMKIEKLNSHSLKSAVREIIGSCDSMGVTIGGKKARVVQKELEKGLHDKALAAE